MIYKTRVSARIDQGKKRSYNEDFAGFFEPDYPQDLTRSGNVYVVADGVGRSSKGDLASRYAVQSLLHEYYRHPKMEIEKRLKKFIQEAGNEIFIYAEESGGFRRMATTLVAGVIHDGKLTVANVGDSRAYLFRDGKLEQLTQDHALVAEMLRNGTLTPEEADRSSLKNRITRSLGGEKDVKVDVLQDIPLQPGDKILLCSDGLTRYGKEGVWSRFLVEDNPSEITDRLVKFANQRGGEDNVSVLVVSIGQKVAQPLPVLGSKVMPEAAHWEELETQPPAPATITLGEEEEIRRSPIPYLVGLAAVFLIGFLVISPWGRGLFGVGQTTPTQEQAAVLQAFPTVVRENLSPTPTTLPPTQTTMVESTSASTIQPTEQPAITPEPTVPAQAACVIRYRQPDPGTNSLYLLLRDTLGMDIGYAEFVADYAPRVSCLEGLEGECRYDIAAYEFVGDGWVLRLPAVDKERCKAAGGTVVLEE